MVIILKDPIVLINFGLLVFPSWWQLTFSDQSTYFGIVPATAIQYKCFPIAILAA
jgi:hypothetical protein